MQFNYRVLQEAMDKEANPLFERLKFLAIYSNNLSEFFKVRVAHHKNLYRLNKKFKKEYDIESKKVLIQLLKMVNDQQLEFTDIFENQIVPELREIGIDLKKRLELSEKQFKYIKTYFNDHLLPYVQPMLLVGKKIKPFLNSAALYLAVELEDKETKLINYALVQIPADKIYRIIILPKSKPDVQDVIFLDDIIRHNIADIFPGYNIIQSYSIKLTRDADLYIDDEFSGDFIKKLKKSLKKRKVGPPARLVYDRLMPKTFLNYLMKVFELDSLDIIPEGRYHNNFDLFKFPDFGKDYLKLKQLEPLPIKELEDSSNILDVVKVNDYFINMPFHSYESVIRFFEDVAEDESVTHIKIVQYRVAGVSKKNKSMKKPVIKGKHV
jgi:polyphosphate kinase